MCAFNFFDSPTTMKRFLSAFLLTLLCATGVAQEKSNKDWLPTGEWPFINKRFEVATVYSGLFSVKKTVVPCNIHIGNQAVWYVQNDTLMEANKGTVIRVVFPDSTVYVPVGMHSFGKIVREDSLKGKLARIIQVVEVDQAEVDRDGKNHQAFNSSLLQGGGGLSSLAARVADANAGIRQEELPIPTINRFYFLYDGDLFEATNQNILKHIDQSRRREYRIFTRSAEIISTNLSSMLKVWENFFVKYDK